MKYYVEIISLIISSTMPIVVLYINDKFQKSQNEIKIHDKISYARNKYQDLALSYKKENELHKKVLDSSLEDYINMYEIACSFYFYKKVDKRSFDILYCKEILDIVEKIKNINYININEYPSIYKYYNLKIKCNEYNQKTIIIVITTITIVCMISIYFYLYLS